MKNSNIKTLCFIWISLFLASLLADLLLGRTYSIEFYPYRFISLIFISIPLIYYAGHSTLRGTNLYLSVFVIFFVIGTFNILVEAYIFNVTSRAETLNEMFQGLIGTILGSIAIAYFTPSNINASALQINRSVLSWTWRVLLGNFLYFMFYLSAGLILSFVYPGLQEFYANKLPPMELIIQTNLFFRGFIFVTIAALIVKTTTLNRIRAAVLIGITFSILGGIAPLISPNEFMPLNIRLAHGFEVGISNFLYGLVLGHLLIPKQRLSK